MDNLESQLSAMMADPKIMAQVQAMAQNLGMQSSSEGTAQMSPEAMQAISGLMSGGSTDPDQQNLLKALSPYLSKHHLAKLEQAMRAAKMADTASHFFNSGR